MKKVTINVPDDCEVQIVRKEVKPVTYQDLIDSNKKLKGYVISTSSEIDNIEVWATNSTKSVAISEKVAKSMLAMSMISQLMPYYGGAITDEEWANSLTYKYVICKVGKKLQSNYAIIHTYQFLAFHTEEQRDNFLKYNYELVKDYLMIN